MMETIIWVGVGAFVGWNLPQPQYAVKLQAWVLHKVLIMLGK